MKKWISRYCVLLRESGIKMMCLIVGLSLLTACGNNKTNGDKKNEKQKESVSTETYACPMHPEVTGVKGDECNKCGMELMPVDASTNAKVYVMEMKTEPAKLSAQTSGKLLLTPKINGAESDRVPLDVVHEKKMHLIIVSNDLNYFDHVHPEYQASGDYVIQISDAGGVATAGVANNTTQFPHGGEYTLFADYMPSGAGHQLEKLHLQVNGKSVQQVSWTKEALTGSVGDFTMTLKPGGGKFVTKKSMHIDAPLMYKGKPILTSELDNFLGAKAHMVVIGVNDMSYLHVHPEEFEGNLDLHANFERPGMYRGWIQFSYKGKLQTISFVINAEEGSGESDASDHDHEHEHNH